MREKMMNRLAIMPDIRAVLPIFCLIIGVTGVLRAGAALNFNNGNYVRVEDSASLNITGQITMEAWIYKTWNGEDYNIIFSKPWDGDWNPWHVYRMGLQPAGNVPKQALFTLALSGGIVGVATYSTIPDNTWVHIACTYDGGTMNIYMNGVLESSVAASGTIQTSNQPLIIGRNLLNTWNDWFGRIDEVRLWNVARTYQEIQDNMCRSLVGNETGLVGYWKFDEGSGNLSGDSSANGNNGTLVGSPAWDTGKSDCPSCAPPPSGMVGWWGGDNNALDLAGANHGTPINGATYASGKVGEAFNLNGSSGYVQLTDSAALRPSVITVDAWIKLTSSPPSAAIIFDQESALPWYGYELYVSSENKLTVDVYASAQVTLVGNTVLQPSTWYHVGMTYDGANLKSYVNGTEDGSRPITGPINYSIPATPVIGKRSIGSSNYFPGLIDEVEVFNRALSATEIATIYSADSAGKCRSCSPVLPGLVSWWKAEDTSKDYIGSNHGALVNGAGYVNGRVGKAFSLDGADDYVLVGDPVPASLQIQNEITLEAWIYAFEYPSSGTLRAIVGSQYDTTGSGATIFLDGRTNPDGHSGVPAGHIHFQIGDGLWHPSNTQSQVPLGQWVHIVAVRKANENARVYYNGVLQPSVSDAWSGSIAYNGAWFAIGQQKDVIRPFKGLIDEPAVYNRALTADEISWLYNAGNAGKCTLVPRPIPDGTSMGTPLSVTKLALDGSQLSIGWDNRCNPLKTDILYGMIDQLPGYGLFGSKCDIANPDTWNITDTNIWFVLISDDGWGTESSWGMATTGQRNGSNPSYRCGNAERDNSGACP